MTLTIIIMCCVFCYTPLTRYVAKLLEKEEDSGFIANLHEPRMPIVINEHEKNKWGSPRGYKVRGPGGGGVWRCSRVRGRGCTTQTLTCVCVFCAACRTLNCHKSTQQVQLNRPLANLEPAGYKRSAGLGACCSLCSSLAASVHRDNRQPSLLLLARWATTIPARCTHRLLEVELCGHRPQRRRDPQQQHVQPGWKHCVFMNNDL